MQNKSLLTTALLLISLPLSLLVLSHSLVSKNHNNAISGTTSFANGTHSADVNGDGAVDVADIASIINVMAGGASESLTASADVNDDGTVDVADIATIINVMAGIVETPAEFSERVREDVSDYLNAKNNATFEDIQAYLKKYGNQISSEVRDSLLVISMPDDYRLDVDLYGVCCLKPSNWDEYNEAEIEAFAQDIVNHLAFSDDETNNSRRHLSAKAISPQSFVIPDVSIKTNRKVLIWAPYAKEVSKTSSLMEKINENIKKTFDLEDNVFTITTITGIDCTPNSMKEFSDYGLVYIDTHGYNRNIPDENGIFLLYPPKNWKTAEDKISKQYQEMNLKHELLTFEGEVWCGLYSDHLKEKLPDLSHTIIWTCVCHAQKDDSETRKGFMFASRAFYTGAISTTTDYVPLRMFEKFAWLFYLGDQAQYAWEEIGGNQPNYVASYSASPVYIEDYIHARSIKPKDKQARVNILSPTECAPVYVSRGLKAPRASNNYIEDVGVCFTNKATGEVTEFVIDETNVTVEERKDYKGLTNMKLIVNTDDLPDGTYEYRTYLSIDGEKTYSEETFEFTKGDNLCPDDNHPHMIDLGLPSGTKWACCNVGASTPEEYGSYYAWGETSPKSVYNWDTYQSFKNKEIAGTNDDAATANWGTPWKMPTKDQYLELKDNCSSVWIKQNSVNGRKFVGPNGISIFLPATGYCWGSDTSDVGDKGHYWSSSPDMGYYAYYIVFDSEDISITNQFVINGRCIRPVYQN